MKSIIYRSTLIYKIITKLIYGKSYTKRYRLIADEVGEANVLDLCCGDCQLAKYVKKYKGADLNSVFIKSSRKKGLNVIKLDVLNDEIPLSECIVMQASLYQFYPKHKKIIKKMLEKSKKVIISEGIVHFAHSNVKPVANIAKLLTKTSEEHKYRFTKEKLISLYEEFGAKKIIPAGRELIGVFET